MPSAAHADEPLGAWEVSGDASSPVLSILAREGDNCSANPMILRIACVDQGMAMTIETDCVPDRYFADGAGLLFTFEYIDDDNPIFNDSSEYPFLASEDRHTLSYGDAYTAELVARMANNKIDDLGITVVVDDAPRVSHFATAHLTAALRHVDMQCGVQPLLER